MSKEIKGSVNVLASASTNGKYLVNSVGGQTFDENGELTIDAYTESEIQKIIGVLPLSHYGSFSFLPAGIYGSFEGASDVPSYRYRRIHLEDDGTLIILRPGTNGAKRGLYYSYLDNILETTDLNTAINTNKEYKPGYFGNNYIGKMAFASDSKIVSGLATDSSNNEYIFISWINGTLNDQQHVGSIVRSNVINPNGGIVSFVMTGNTEIFFFIELNDPNTLQYEIKSVPLSQVQSSATSLTVTSYDNWTSNTFYNRTITNKKLVINETLISTDPSSYPYVLIPSTATSNNAFMSGGDIYAAQNAAGTIRLRVVGDCYCSSPARSVRPKHSFSFLLNTNTKTATLESGNIAPITITDPGNGFALGASGATITTDPILTNNGNRVNLFNSYYYMDNGTVLGIGSQNLGSAPTYLFRAKYPNSTSIYDILQVRSHTSTDFYIGSMNTSFGSPVGSDVQAFEWLPSNRYKVASFNEKSVYQLSLNEYVPVPDYTFKSVSLGTIKGFEPTTNRKSINFDLNNRIFISSITGDTVTTNGGIFIEDYRVSTPLSYDGNLQSTGSISISNTLLNTLKTQQLSNVSYTIDLNNKSAITLYVPQQADCPAFALITACTPSLTNYYKMIEVNVNTRVGVINTLTFKRLVAEGTGTFGGLATDATYGVPNTCVGLTIYDAGSFYFIGGVDTYMYRTQGDTNSITWRAKVTKSTQQMDDFKVSGTYQNHTPSAGTGFLPWAVPGVGFGYLDYAAQANDDRVRIIFQPVGTTLEQYNAWSDSGDKILLASQDVAEGFIVYFTEETPVLLSGKSFTMPIQSIDLTTVKENPANSTFHIYVRMKQGLTEYYATEQVIAETGTTAYNTLWIGTVTTNDIQISSINILKRSRLDVFGASLEAAGSSFPVSYGVPSSTGIINW